MRNLEAAASAPTAASDAVAETGAPRDSNSLCSTWAEAAPPIARLGEDAPRPLLSCCPPLLGGGV